MKKIVLLIGLCFLLQGCVASFYTLSPRVLDNQKKIDRGGIESVLSTKKEGSVLVRGVSDQFSSEDRPKFVVGVYGEKEFTFSSANVKAYVDGKPLKVFSLEEIVDEVKNNLEARILEAKESFKAKSRKAVEDNAQKDSREINTNIFTSSKTNTRIVGQSDSGIYRTDTESMEEDQKAASLELNTKIDSIKRDTAILVKNLKEKALRPATVPPKTWYRGEVYMDKIPGEVHEIKVAVTLFGDKHEFILNCTQVKK